MARGRRKAADIAEEQPAPENGGVEDKQDFELARKLYFSDIKPAISRSAEHAQEASTAYKAIKKQANIDMAAAKLAFKVVEMEEGAQQHFLRSLVGMFEIMNIALEADLIDVMQGHNSGAQVIPLRQPEASPLPTFAGEGDD